MMCAAATSDAPQASSGVFRIFVICGFTGDEAFFGRGARRETRPKGTHPGTAERRPVGDVWKTDHANEHDPISVHESSEVLDFVAVGF